MTSTSSGNASLARWATPLCAGSFFLSAVTGILLFFHLSPGLVRVAHEWLSWLLVFAVGFHLTLYWRAFGRYFRSPPALALMLGCVVVALASMLPVTGTPAQGPNPRAVSRKLINLAAGSELRELASLQDVGANELAERLRASGLVVVDANQTVDQIARYNGTEALTVIAKLF